MSGGIETIGRGSLPADRSEPGCRVRQNRQGPAAATQPDQALVESCTHRVRVFAHAACHV